MLDREIKDIVRQLIEQGWRVRPSPKGPDHYVAYPPDPAQKPYCFSGSGDWRAVRNTITQLKRRGFEA
jgi:hypothetical protein